MKKAKILLLLFLLLTPSLVVAQTPRSATGAANRSWPKFYAAFRAAVNNRDREKLKSMMASEMFGDGISTKDEIITQIDNNRLWGYMQKALASGFKRHPIEYGEDKGRPAWITKKHLGLIFIFKADRRWYWVGFMGD